MDTTANEAQKFHESQQRPGVVLPDVMTHKLIFLCGTEGNALSAARYNLARILDIRSVPDLGQTKIWFAEPGRAVLYIEHPQVAQHPRDQVAWLTGELEAQRNTPCCLVLRTHSEAMINFVGGLIEDGGIDLKATDVSAVLCEGDETRVCPFDERGYLQDWPVGYFSW